MSFFRNDEESLSAQFLPRGYVLAPAEDRAALDRIRDFVAAMFAGRFVRFLTLALLTLWFGPQIVELTASVVRQHFAWLLGAIAGGVLVWLLMRRSKKRKNEVRP